MDMIEKEFRQRMRKLKKLKSDFVRDYKEIYAEEGIEYSYLLVCLDDIRQEFDIYKVKGMD